MMPPRKEPKPNHVLLESLELAGFAGVGVGLFAYDWRISLITLGCIILIASFIGRLRK